MEKLLNWIGYDSKADVRHRFTYVINGFSIGLVLLFMLFYVIVVKSWLVNLVTSVCLLMLLSVFVFMKKGFFKIGKTVMISAFFMQVIALVFLWFPIEAHLNYFLFIAIPISFFIFEFSVREERILIIITDTVTVVLMVLSDTVGGLELVEISDWMIRTFSVMSVLSTISSLTIVFYYYASNLTEVHNELRKLAGTDSLTGIANRRVLFEEGHDYFRLATKYHRQFSLMLIDIDFFKNINDKYGHPVGDRVLEELADLLRNNVRQRDLCARYGGEEFAVILKDAEPEGNLTIAKNFHQQVENHLFSITENERIAITVSIGITSFQDNLDDFDQMVVKADQALYLAKENGRNQIVEG
jgi:diguanylate cyclase (GGDEF)-like protein